MLLFKNILVKRFLFIFILAVGIALRLYKWNGYSLWYDEVQWPIIFLLKNDLFNSLKDTICIGKPPLFAALLYFWRFLGQNEFILRLLPFIFGTLSILITYKVGKLLFDERIGIIAAVFIVFSPLHIYYSQELTHYSLTIFLVLCSIYYLIRCLKEDKFHLWLLFIVFTSLSLYTNYLCLSLIMAENVFLFSLHNRREKLQKIWLLSQLIIGISYIPWMLLLPRQFYLYSLWHNYLDWIPKGSSAYIFQALRLFNVGYNANFIIHFLASLLFFPLLLTGIFFGFKNKNWQIKLLMLWLFVPMLLSILFSGIQPSFTYRNFIFTLPAYYFIIALGIVKLKRYVYIPIFSFIILSAFALNNYYKNIFPYPEQFYRPGVHAKKDSRAASKYIIKNFQEGDIVCHTSVSTAAPFLYYQSIYSNKKLYQSEKKPPLDGNNFVVEDRSEILPYIRNKRRIWLVLSSWEPQELNVSISGKENEIKKWMEDNCKAVEIKEFPGIQVCLYKIET
jgi:mannosyltransferase